MTYPHFLVAAVATVANALTHLFGRRRTLLLEGRFRRGRYSNWSGVRRHRARWSAPTTEQEVIDVVRSSTALRVVGAGHSFNDGLITDGTTLSLDGLSGIISVDTDLLQARVWGGTRLRDLTRALAGHGLALRVLASHDAQSIAGVLATDVHGTGREPAHTSDLVVSMRIVDGSGGVHDVGPGDDLFRAAVGGIGAVGVITQVTLQCVEAFDLRKTSTVETRGWARRNLDRLLRDHDHASFYVYPFTELVHAHTWDRTHAPRSPLGTLREALSETKAAIAVGVFGDAAAHWERLPSAAGAGMRMQTATNLVLPSAQAFSRSQYHLHQELEVAVPLERVWEDLDELIGLYERMYAEGPLPFLLVEVRFTPGGHDCSLLGAGVGRPTAWLCLCLNQSGRVGAYFDDVEEWVRTHDARVHLGKWVERLTADDLVRMHAARMDLFSRVRAEFDPDGRFRNAFLDRVLGPVRGRAAPGRR